MGDVDALTGRYRLPCPTTGTCGVRLSSFREIERLPGAAHPAVYRVAFACTCGDEHTALVGHDALDWAPLGLTERGLVRQPHDVPRRTSSPIELLRDRAPRTSAVARGRGASSATSRTRPAGDAVGVPPARPVRRRARARRPLPGLRVDFGQPRHAVPRGRPVPLGRAGWCRLRTSSPRTSSARSPTSAPELGSATFDEKRLLLDG